MAQADDQSPENGARSQSALRRVGATLRSRWRLDALLGIGGTACVYAATHRNGLRAAVKILDPSAATSIEMRERFYREAILSNKLADVGGVRVYDDDETDDGAPYLVMELLRGATLDVLAAERGERLPVDEVRGHALSLLKTLAVAHSLGIVHRDVKPENVLLTERGDVRLLDFGLARAIGERSVRRSADPMGTPAFMSPEQARGRAEWIDAQSDLYSVGATMFTLLSGELVHGDAKSTNEMIVATFSRPARSLASVLPGAPRDVTDVVDRALELKKSDRWACADDMHRALARTLRRGEGGSRVAALR